MKVKVGVSNRHVHLTEETYKYLFDKDTLEVRNPLNQIGEFASTDTVDIEYLGKVIEHIRIVGPFRDHNQVELLKSDLDFIGLNAPVRRSGVLDNTPSVNIKVNGKEIETDGVIRAERHVHVPTKDEETLDLHEREELIVTAPNCKFSATVKVSDNGYFELHIDKDEARDYGLKNGDEVTFEKK